VEFDRQGISDHANNLAATIQLNLKRSLEAIGVVSTAVRGAGGLMRVVQSYAACLLSPCNLHMPHIPLLHCSSILLD